MQYSNKQSDPIIFFKAIEGRNSTFFELSKVIS